MLRGRVTSWHLRAPVFDSGIQQFATGKLLDRLQFCSGAYRCDWPVLQSLLYSHLLSERLRAFLCSVHGDRVVVDFHIDTHKLHKALVHSVIDRALVLDRIATACPSLFHFENGFEAGLSQRGFETHSAG